jgi:hypothetical protein
VLPLNRPPGGTLRGQGLERRRALALALGAALACRARADGLPEPTGAVVLVLSGRIKRTNRAGTAAFDMAMLEALPQHSFTARTPWYAQPRKFTGPLLRDVIAAAGGEGQTLRVSALNDYRIDIPFDDAQRFDVLLARLLDDTPMTVREKGPLFMIYPFDAQPSLRSARYYSRSVWQLTTIELI